MEGRLTAADLQHIDQLTESITCFFGTFYNSIAAMLKVLFPIGVGISDILCLVGGIIRCCGVTLDIGIQEHICNRVVIVLEGIGDILPQLDTVNVDDGFQTVRNRTIMVGTTFSSGIGTLAILAVVGMVFVAG